MSDADRRQQAANILQKCFQARGLAELHPRSVCRHMAQQLPAATLDAVLQAACAEMRASGDVCKAAAAIIDIAASGPQNEQQPAAAEPPADVDQAGETETAADAEGVEGPSENLKSEI